MPAWRHESETHADTLRWSAPLGDWWGTPVRLHVSLALVFAVGGVLAWQARSRELAAALVAYLAALALHEGAHALAAWRVRGRHAPVVLTPVGGLRRETAGDDPESRVFVAMAGPLANLAAVVAAVVVLSLGEEPALGLLFYPHVDSQWRPVLGGAPIDGGASLAAVAKLVVWVNWPLFLLNLAPAAPFDGGEVLRSLLAPRLGTSSASTVVAWGAQWGGIALVAAAPLVAPIEGAQPAPALVLAAMGVLLLFGGRLDRLAADEERFGLAAGTFAEGRLVFDPDLDSDRAREVVLVEASRGTALAENLGLTLPDDPRDDERLDAVLEKVHHRGMAGLTAAERAVLEHASRRFQRRRGED